MLSYKFLLTVCVKIITLHSVVICSSHKPFAATILILSDQFHVITVSKKGKMIMRPCDCHVPTPHFVFAKKTNVRSSLQLSQLQLPDNLSPTILLAQSSVAYIVHWPRRSCNPGPAAAAAAAAANQCSAKQPVFSPWRSLACFCFTCHGEQREAYNCVRPTKKSTPTAQPRRGVHNAKGKQMQIRASRELKFRLLACALFPRTAGRTEDDRALTQSFRKGTRTLGQTICGMQICVFLPSLSVNRED